ncbi:MAG: hypothetical protein ABIH18_07855 [Candidatus Omnitrophota bacterium]
MRKSRPGSIIVVGWVTIILGVFSFLYTLRIPAYYNAFIKASNEFNLLLSIIVSSFVTIVYLVCGIAILCGKNWGRFSYIIFVGFITAITLLSNNFSVINIPYVFLYCIFIFLLLRPEAGKFFKPGKNKDIL